MTEQRQRLSVAPRVGHNRDVHPLDFVHLGIVDLRKYQLVAQPQGVIAAPVKGPRREPAKVPYSGQSHVGQAVQKLVHPVAAQRHHRPNGHVLAQLEVGDRLPRPGDHRLLSGDLAQLSRRRIQQLGILDRFSEPHVHHDLAQARHGHDVPVVEFLHQGRSNLVPILLFQSRYHIESILSPSAS